MCKVLVAYFKDVSSQAAVSLHERNRRAWASSVCYVLYRHGFDEVWENQKVGDELNFWKEFKDRLLILYKQDLATNLRTNDRFSYSTFKSNLSLSPYLNDLKHVKARNVLIRIRLGVSALKTHKLRFATNTTQVDLACPFCRNDTETEMQFILICPRYKEIRELYIPKQYYNCLSSFKLTLLLATSNKSLLLRLATYIFKAFQIRN